jgi:hypothetical protein
VHSGFEDTVRNRAVDFLVDEEEGITVETVIEIVSNSKFPED